MLNPKEVVNQIYSIASSSPYLRHVWKSYIKKAVEEDRVVLTIKDNRVVSFIIFKEYKRRPNIGKVHIKYLATSSKFRGQGYMSLLIQKFMEKFHGKAIYIDTDFDNIPMRLFLKKHKFHKVGTTLFGRIKKIERETWCHGTSESFW